MRLAKSFSAKSMRLRTMVDLYNLFNVSPVTNLNQRYGLSWQQPFTILPGRFLKLGMQLDF